MKKLKSLTILAVISLFCFSCGEKKPEENSKIQQTSENTNPQIQEIKKACTDSKVPKNLDELNELVRFNVDLDDQCNFQPVHIEKCATKEYVIIGRFKSSKKNGNSKNIKSLELHVYNLSDDEGQINTKYKVVKIDSVKTEIKDLVKIDVVLSTDPNADENFLKVFSKEIKVTKNTIIDFNVEDGNPCLFESRICQTNVIFE